MRGINLTATQQCKFLFNPTRSTGDNAMGKNVGLHSLVFGTGRIGERASIFENILL